MKRFGIGLVALLLFVPSMGTCGADGLCYKVGYHPENVFGVEGPAIAVVGEEGADAGFDGEGMWPSVPSSGILLGMRRISGVDGWDGTTGWYQGDAREAVAPGHTVIVDGIYLWAVTGTQPWDGIITVRPHAPPFLDAGVSFTLSLVSIPQGVEYTGPTSWGPETTEITLPFYSTDDGTTGYRFRINVFAVPEPGSLIVLAGGLAGMGASLLRRRR